MPVDDSYIAAIGESVRKLSARHGRICERVFMNGRDDEIDDAIAVRSATYSVVSWPRCESLQAGRLTLRAFDGTDCPCWNLIA